MVDPLAWTEVGGDRRLLLDGPAEEGGRYLAVRRDATGDGWTAAAVLVAGEAEREIGDGLWSPEYAQDAAVKLAIQTLARLHGVSPAPGLPELDADPAEHLIARLWALLAASGGGPPPAP